MTEETFGGESTGSTPSGWTPEWESDGSEWSVFGGSSGSGGGDVIGGGDGYGDTYTASDSDVDAVASSESELESALDSASAGDVVFLDSNIVTYQMEVPQDVTLAGDRGVNGQSGAMIESSEPRQALRPQDGSLVTGLRIIGPNSGNEGGEWGYGIRGFGQFEIANCEIAFWGEGGIVVDGSGNPPRVHMHHCYSHDTNRDTDGYGLNIGGGERGLVEYNYFHNHRHCIAANGTMDGYTFRYNHLSNVQTHANIDIHGQNGESGRYSEVNNNILEYDGSTGDTTRGMQIRGEPTDACHVWENWFYIDIPPDTSQEGGAGAIVRVNSSDWNNIYFTEPPTESRASADDENFYGEGARSSFDQIIPNHPGPWHRPWDSSTGESDDVNLVDDRGLRFEASSNIRHALQWADEGTFSDVEIETLSRVPAFSPNNGHARIVLRGGGSATNEDGYIFDVTETETAISLYDGGGLTTLGTSAETFDPNTWYRTRFRAIGDTLRGKVWAADVTEPSGWQIDEQDATHGSGWVGVGSFDASVSEWDIVETTNIGQVPPSTYVDGIYQSTASGTLVSSGAGVTITEL